jgi:hypothetical protein
MQINYRHFIFLNDFCVQLQTKIYVITFICIPMEDGVISPCCVV